MKIAFSFFLLMYSRCGAPASWAARHTIVCLDFTHIIGHNSLNVHRIPTKVGTEIRLNVNEPLKCAKFQPYPSTQSCFMADFAKCAK